MLQKIEIGSITERKCERPDSYRWALSFRRAFRWAAMYSLKFGGLRKRSEPSLFAPLSPSDIIGLQQV